MSQSLNENQASNGPPPQDSQPASALDIAQSLMALSTSLRHSLPSQSEWADPTWNADKVRHTIDQGILLLGELKSYRNSIAPISFLPDEILAEIFMQYILLSSDPYSSKWTRRILLVCRKWRSVALDHAKLWCWISSDSTRRMYRWEKRSKKHPLHCKLDATHPVIFLRNSERIRSLQVSGADPELRDFFQGNITNLPILETLIIQSFGGDLHDDGDSVDTWHVPSWIVDGGAPRLRSLKLDSAFFSTGKMNLLENLLHLSLEQEAVPSGSHCLPHFEDLAAVLRRSPRLQTLNIQHYIETQTIWQQRSLFGASIHLPELHHLEVNADIVVATALLNSIVMPSYTTVLLKGHRHLVDGYFSDLSDLMVPVRRHLQQTEFRSINLDRPFEFWVSISASTDCECGGKRSNLFRIDALARNQKELRKAIPKIIHAIPLTRVVYLDASGIMFDEQDTSGDLGGNRWEQLSPQTWRTVLELLPRGITIRMTVSEGLISLFNGMLEIMENRFVNASGRASRRYIRAHGQPRFALLQLTETRLSGLSAVTHNLKIRDLYNEFVSLLVEYEGLVAASGELEGTLSLNELCIDLDTSRARSSYIYQLAPRLFNVTTSQLKLNGKLYSPLQQKTFNRMRDKSNRDMLRILGGSDSEDEP